eukprot:gene11502-13417_t
MRGSGLVIGILALLFSVILLSVSLSDSIKGHTPSLPEGDPNSLTDYTNKLPLWVLDGADVNRLRSHVQYLSADLLQGRFPGTNGEVLATSYVQSMFQAAYLTPMGDDGSYIQTVEMYSFTVTPDQVSSMDLAVSSGAGNGSGNGSISLGYLEEFTVTLDQRNTTITVDRVELVFAGYGIEAPLWNDYKNVDVKNKIVVLLPGLPPAIPVDTMSMYYGRPLYKYETALKKGAFGVVMVNSNKSLESPWSLVQSSATHQQLRLIQMDNTTSLAIRSWVTQDAGDRLAKMSLAGGSYDKWLQDAKSVDFRPQDLGVTLSLTVSNVTYTAVAGKQVIGGINGTVAHNELVVVMAHHDHIGMDTTNASNPIIYPGAIDNASGVSVMLETATLLGMYAKFASTHSISGIGPMVRPSRTILFVSSTAEEAGFLGAQYLLANLKPEQKIVSVINFDGANVYDVTDDIISVGLGLSPSLDKFVNVSATDESMVVSPDQIPQLGLMYRNDAFIFIKNNIPAIMLSVGSHFKGNPSFYQTTILNYFANIYHTPSDSYPGTPAFTFQGAIQQVRITSRLAYYLGCSSEWPTIDTNSTTPIPFQ